ncbi:MULTISPECIES: hypothetical protein [Thermus]|uniref:hypothetical protein n=1 Tax=Thermus TaxID=270 RepID=UPI001F188FEB|nr:MULTISPECIES: hypothetical protein [Thermus]
MTPRSFFADLAYGRAAEADPKVRALLGQLYPGYPITPAPPGLDLEGVDLVIDRPGFPVPVQVKRYRGTLHPLRTALVFLEDIADLDRGTPGWLWTSPADLLVIAYADEPLALHLPTLRAIAAERGEKWGPYLDITKTEGRGGRIWYSVVWRVPLREVEGAVLTIPKEAQGR